MFSVTWNLKSDDLSIISLVTAAGSLAIVLRVRTAMRALTAISPSYFLASAMR